MYHGGMMRTIHNARAEAFKEYRDAQLSLRDLFCQGKRNGSHVRALLRRINKYRQMYRSFQ